MLSALRALLDDAPEASLAFARLAAQHSDPEALFLYGAGQARVGDGPGALATLSASLDGGFAVPDALRSHPWLGAIRSEAALAGLVDRAEAARGEAARAFLEAGGPSLLGV
jgi:hypothetical protein